MLTLASLPLAAQTGLGVVRGTVQDATKAVMPKAKVDLSNTQTGVLRSSETNEAGLYYFSGVPVGTYKLSATSAGFKRWEGELILTAGQTLSIDPILEVGTIENTVEVTGAAPVIATEGAQVSDTKDALRIHNLPLNGRSITGLFDLSPGVVGGGSPRVNGMKVGATEMLLDGVSLVDRFGGGMSRVQPGLDTVQEFRVETAGSNAVYARPATVSMVTRSGTNAFHGAAFETLRNNAAGLRSRTRQDISGSASKLIRNEFGFWAGGPVLLPKVYNGKNKTFWFMNLEYLKQRQAVYAETAVPTAAMWGGDFSNMTDNNKNGYTLYDPNTTGPNGTRTPFAGNTIPKARLNQIAGVMQSISPVPNFNLDQNPWTAKNFRTYYPLVVDQHSMTFKGDQTFSAKDSLSGRYTKSPNYTAQYGNYFGFPPPGCTDCGGTSRRNYVVHSMNLRETHVFNPTFINELVLSAQRGATDTGTLGDQTNWGNKLGLPNPFGVTGWPTIYSDAGNMFYGGGWDGDNRKNQMMTNYNVEDNVTWIKGRHTIQFGGKARLEQNNIREMQQAQGSHGFYANWTTLYDPSAQGATSYTGSGLAEMMMGLPSGLANQYNRGYFYFRQKEFGTYFNDTWKVTPRLTLGLGLRWDHWQPYKEKYDRMTTINMDQNSAYQVITPHSTTIEQMPGIPAGVLSSWKATGLTWVTADSAQFPGALIQNYWKDLGPRGSMAYRVNDKTVIRAGYGMYYWPMPLSQILQAMRSNPPLNLRFRNSVRDKNGTVANYALLNVPASTDYLPNAIVDVNSAMGIGAGSQSMIIMDPKNWADDRMQQWTFNIEREVVKDTSLRLSYIGTHGSNLEQRLAWNTPETVYNYVARTGLNVVAGTLGTDARRYNKYWNATLQSHVGFSNSNSLQMEVQRRFAQGLSFQAFYVYNHALTTTDESGFGSGGGGATAPEGKTVLGNPNLTLEERLRLVYYNSGAIPPHQIKWNGIYEMPFGKGKKFANQANKALNAVIGGWQLA
ncbi:MAG: TonB-dependent receptor, partial [Acidobacteria bacterium]|nr:TonB-dependent receptor [Acidobacteriota bacterium]